MWADIAPVLRKAGGVGWSGAPLRFLTLYLPARFGGGGRRCYPVGAPGSDP